MTMRELLDMLKTATEEERREFSEWWANLPADTSYIEDSYLGKLFTSQPKAKVTGSYTAPVYPVTEE